MGKVFKRLPSPSMAVAFVALLAALGGTAVALPGKNGVKKDDIAKGAVNTTDIANNTIGTQDIRTSAVRGSDVAANTLKGSDIDEGSLGTVPSANTANSANTATSATTATSAGSAQPAAFAHVSSGTGTLDTGNSKNVGSVTVNTDPSTPSLYCISGIPFTPRGGQATVDGLAGGGTDGAQFSLGTLPGCPAGTQAMVYTYSSSGGNPAGFFVVFYQ